MVSESDISKFIDNQLIYLDRFIISNKNIKREAKTRYSIPFECMLNKIQIKETKEYLIKKFIKNIVYKIIEINNSYTPKKNTSFENDIYYFD